MRLRGDDLEDALQETRIRAYRAFSAFDGRTRFSTWACKIAVNYVRSVARKRARGLAVVPLVILDREPAAEDDREASGMMPAIMAAIDELPPVHRRVFLMIEVDGASYEEAARALRVPVGTVKSRLYGAKRRLQERLGPLISA
jgi:RNA polymerase sigma-70 factor (ECF subfamily)